MHLRSFFALPFFRAIVDWNWIEKSYLSQEEIFSSIQFHWKWCKKSQQGCFWRLVLQTRGSSTPVWGDRCKINKIDERSRHHINSCHRTLQRSMNYRSSVSFANGIKPMRLKSMSIIFQQRTHGGKIILFPSLMRFYVGSDQQPIDDLSTSVRRLKE